jgi:ABC-2 type transport system ATP-binding protein
MELQINNVSKQYRRGTWGLHEVSLRLGPGVIGLLGPNGAGKTTLMNILATITRPSSGQVLWNGVDCATQRTGCAGCWVICRKILASTRT